MLPSQFMKRNSNDSFENKKKNHKKNIHSVPVPRVYKESAKLLKEVEDGGSIQNLIYKVKHRNIKAIYALVCNSMRNKTLLERIFEQCNLSTEGQFDPHLAKVLASELLWGKNTLPGESKPVKLMMGLKSQLEAALKSSDIPVAQEVGIKPRYARVNTVLTTVEGTIKTLEVNDWQVIETPATYDEFLDCAINMNEDQFMKDFHFDDLLVFPPKSELYSDPLVEKGYLILQDKASCLAPLLLNPAPNSVVLDMCAAPGVKTVHLCNMMKNKGTLFAVDKHPQRFNCLNEFVSKFCGRHNCVQTIMSDAANLTKEQCPEVQYILVDPSCTGTGMTKRIEDQNDVTNVESKRIEKLSGFQVRLLIQALTEFPTVRRVVYCTCSVLKEENEQVIERVLTRVPGFQVVEPNFGKWERRGNPQFSFGSRCLTSDLDGDLTNGMFIAVLEKISSQCDEKMEADNTDEGWQVPKSRKNRKRKSDVSLNSSVNSSEEMMEDTPSVPKKKLSIGKKKKKSHKKEEN